MLQAIREEKTRWPRSTSRNTRIGKSDFVSLTDCRKSNEALRLADGEVTEEHGVDQSEDAVFAPMPRAKERIATAVKPGFLPRTRRV